MTRNIVLLLVSTSAIATAFALSPAAPIPNPETDQPASYVYTNGLALDPSGVALLPPTYKWRIETSWRGIAPDGRNHPDTRVMLRLYDPGSRFSAVTSQIDLETAEQLYRDLGDIIAKKRKNPNYQDRSHTGPHFHYPGVSVKRIVGYDSDGNPKIQEVQNGE